MQEISAGNKPLTAFHLKIVALVTMIVDHVGAVFPFPRAMDDILRSIGRTAFPIYAFFIAEGCRYTRDREKYLLRLGLFGLVSQLPFVFAFYPRDWEPERWWISLITPGNVFYTMFFAVACIHIWETLRHQSRGIQAAGAGVFLGCLALCAYTLLFITGSAVPFIITIALYLIVFLVACHFLGRRGGEKTPDWLANILAALPVLPLVLLAEVLNCDYEGEGVALILFLYLLKDFRWAQLAALGAWSFLEYGWEGGLRLKYAGGYGWAYGLSLQSALPLCFALIAVVLICLYNGRRGKNVKWAFYASYPIHIAILAVLVAVLGL